MGCFACRPKVEVTEDPTVLFHARTGRAAIVSASGSEILNTEFGRGLLYIRQGRLCYESTCGSRLWCECFQRSWALSSISSVAMVENDTEIVMVGDCPHVITLNPGLRVRIPGYGGYGGRDHVLIANVPDAANFQRELNHLLSKRRALSMF